MTTATKKPTTKTKAQVSKKPKKPINNSKSKKPIYVKGVIPKRNKISKWTKVLLQKEIKKWEAFMKVQETTPTLQSFYLFVPKSTIAGWKNNNNQKDMWNEYYNKVYAVVEYHMVTRLMNAGNTAANIMFYMKAVFKYSDRPDQSGVTYEINFSFVNDGPNQLKKENKKNVKDNR